MKKPLTAFIGLSHLGLVTSLVWTKINPPVVGIDKDKEVINSFTKEKLLIKDDESELHETGLNELFKKVRKNFYPTTEFSLLKNADLVFFTKDTPKDSGSQKELNSLIDNAIPYFSDGTTIVIMSQVPTGFCREIKERIKNKRPNLSFYLYHWVDILIMTNAIERFSKPERIIIGSDDLSLSFSPRLKKALKLFSCPVFNMSYESAELTKAAINFYLANSVTFANTLSDFCEAAGANINEVIPALQTDKRIGLFAYLRPTLRIAGGHLERDLLMLSHLAKKEKISSGIVGSILKQNKRRYEWALRKIKSHLKKKNPTICIWGLSYKKDTTSTKNTASIEIIKSLSDKAKLNTYDPMAILPSSIKGYTRFKDKYEALKEADCLLILTDWQEFKEVGTKSVKNLMRNYLIIDAIGIWENKKVQLNDFIYITMGVG